VAATPPSAQAPTEKPPAAEAKPISISYWALGSEGSAMSGGELWANWYVKTFIQYEQEHPGITIDFALKGYDASGSTPVDMANPDVWGVIKQSDVAKLQAIYDQIKHM
jgi:hypothetical protein